VNIKTLFLNPATIIFPLAPPITVENIPAATAVVAEVPFSDALSLSVVQLLSVAGAENKII